MAKAAAKRAPKQETVPEDDANEELDVLELDENLDDVEEPELLPPAWYRAEVRGVELRDNQAGTGKYYDVEFVVQPNNFPADYDTENYPDGFITHYRLLRKPRSGADRRAVTNIRKFMQKLGVSTSTNIIDPNEWVGKEARLKIIHNKYQGETREQIAPGGVEAAE